MSENDVESDTVSDKNRLEQDQKHDPTLKNLFTKAKDGDTEFVVRDNILYRQTKDKHKHLKLQVVLPQNRREDVIKTAHFSPMSGHPGKKKTKHMVTQNFFWPNMSKHIAEVCKSCEPCQRTAKKTHKAAPMQVTPFITEPFHKITLDVVGPLQMTKRKNRSILTYIDFATRYPEISSKSVANALLQIICRLLVPYIILTNRGSDFVSKFMKDVYQYLGIKHMQTAPYRPQPISITLRLAFEAHWMFSGNSGSLPARRRGRHKKDFAPSSDVAQNA